MRKLLLRLASVLLTFAASAAVVMVSRDSKTPMSFGPPEDARTASEPVYRCDKTPDLPLPIDVLLNRYFPGWEFPEVSADDCYSIRENGGPEAYAQVINGDFNDDGSMDYAVLIQTGALATDKGIVKPLRLDLVAFFRKGNGYKMHQVTSEGGSCVMLMRKGETDYDYEKQREFTYPRDSIFSGIGMGGTSYVYEYGAFRAITTSD